VARTYRFIEKLSSGDFRAILRYALKDQNRVAERDRDGEPRGGDGNSGERVSRDDSLSVRYGCQHDCLTGRNRTAGSKHSIHGHRPGGFRSLDRERNSSINVMDTCPSSVHQNLPIRPLGGTFRLSRRLQHIASIQATTSGSILKTGRITGPHALPWKQR
jgi:hypothetical protein